MRSRSSVNGISHASTSMAFSLLELQVALVLLGVALAGMGSLVVMQLKQLQRLESRLDDNTRYFLIPSNATGAQLPLTHLWSRKLSGFASIRQTDSLETPLLPLEIHINFQAPGGVSPGAFSGATYIADRGEIYGDRGNGYTYGWNADNTANTRNRNSALSSDERYDTFAYMQRNGNFQWEIAVPNGTYDVRIVAGDPNDLVSIYRIRVEGIRIVSGIPTPLNRWIEGSGSVTVSDGKLTVSNGGAALNNRINFIDISMTAPQNQVSIVSVEKSPISEEVTAHVMVQ